MRTDKELKLKIDEVREKAFNLIELNQNRNPISRVSIRTIRLIINALEYSLGKHDELLIFSEKYNQTGKESI